MQENNQTISEFIRRTDELSVRSGLNLSEIHTILGISKAMVFGYRSGEYRITQKAWIKLEMAEKKAEEAMGSPHGIAESNGFPKDKENPPEEINELFDGVVREDVVPYLAKPPAEPVPLTMEQRMERMETALCRIADALEKMVEPKA